MAVCRYGTINSTKAIIDKMNNTCKGYGFVDFEVQASAERALKELASRGMQVQMAKIRQAQDPQQVHWVCFCQQYSTKTIGFKWPSFAVLMAERVRRLEN